MHHYRPFSKAYNLLFMIYSLFSCVFNSWSQTVIPDCRVIDHRSIPGWTENAKMYIRVCNTQSSASLERLRKQKNQEEIHIHTKKTGKLQTERAWTRSQTSCITSFQANKQTKVSQLRMFAKCLMFVSRILGTILKNLHAF